MTIEKNNTTYIVTENTKTWTLTKMLGSVPVTYKVSKADCSTWEDLKTFVAENTAF